MENNKVLIAVPSKARVETFQKYTWQWVKEFPDFRLFVEPQDYEAYAFIPGMDASKIVSLSANNRGLAFAKESIYNYAKENEFDFIFKVDDDIKGWTDFRNRTDAQGTKTVFERMLHDCLKKFEEHREVKAIGFPYSFQMYHRQSFSLTSRLQTAYITRLNNFGWHEELNVFEDFWTGLKIRINGGVVLRYELAGMDLGVKVGGGKGGHQVFNRKEQAEREIGVLRRLYPALKVRRVEKKAWEVEPVMRIPYSKQERRAEGLMSVKTRKNGLK